MGRGGRALGHKKTRRMDMEAKDLQTIVVGDEQTVIDTNSASTMQDGCI